MVLYGFFKFKIVISCFFLFSEKPEAEITVDSESHINFLNSIIVDLKKKNEELNQKVDVLVRGGSLSDANS